MHLIRLNLKKDRKDRIILLTTLALTVLRFLVFLFLDDFVTRFLTHEEVLHCRGDLIVHFTSDTGHCCDNTKV